MHAVIALLLLAQEPGAIRGVVRDAVTGTPLAGVTVKAGIVSTVTSAIMVGSNTFPVGAGGNPAPGHVTADFSGANFTYANLHGLPLRLATLVGANFNAARAWKCDFEGVSLPDAKFIGADLHLVCPGGFRLRRIFVFVHLRSR